MKISEVPLNFSVFIYKQKEDRFVKIDGRWYLIGEKAIKWHAG
jgi:hypothetical protein